MLGRKTLNSSPLLLALKNNYIDIMELLLSNGADPNEYIQLDSRDVDMDGKVISIPNKVSALHLAAIANNAKAADLLINHGAIVDSGTAYLTTPLWIAAFLGNKDIVQLLVRRGANLNAISDGRNPLDVAESEGHSEIAAFLRETGALTSHEFMMRATGRNTLETEDEEVVSQKEIGEIGKRADGRMAEKATVYDSALARCKGGARDLSGQAKNPERYRETAAVIRQLGQMHSNESIRTLAAMLAQGDVVCGILASSALSRIGTPAIPYLVLMLKREEMLRDDLIQETLTQSRIEQAFRGMGDIGIEELIKALDNNNATIRANAATLVGTMTSLRLEFPRLSGISDKAAFNSLEKLKSLVKDADLVVQRKAVKALAVRADPSGVRSIVLWVKDEASTCPAPRAPGERKGATIPGVDYEQSHWNFELSFGQLSEAVRALSFGGKPFLDELRRLSTADSEPGIRQAANCLSKEIETRQSSEGSRQHAR